jgi:hypothetical protein
MFTCPPSHSSRTTPSTPRDMANVSKMGHTITVDLPMLRVQRRNLPNGSEPPRETRARDEATQGFTIGDLSSEQKDPDPSTPRPFRSGPRIFLLHAHK